ncbi:Transcriptional regulator, ArsR family [Olavius algarvensis associated proteobacterium Delta 3]|nr:Transcriptional regulator, ArsR family [Olavius algarvensis associated proteobacterium Delta 3]CAB5164475.1 Transcriptional regulator, ArsR family [Olavius algarvensis associated proteobacterium Delta 3]
METAVADRKDTLDVEDLAELCRALGHPARVRILEFLKKMDKCICGTIVDSLPLAQSTVSQHLKQLKSAGLVKGEIEGPRTCYCLDRERLDQFKQYVANL